MQNSDELEGKRRKEREREGINFPHARKVNVHAPHHPLAMHGLREGSHTHTHTLESVWGPIKGEEAPFFPLSFAPSCLAKPSLSPNTKCDASLTHKLM